MNSVLRAHKDTFDDDITGARLLWSRHHIVRLFRRYIREERAISAQFGNTDSIVVTRALRLNPRLDRLYLEYGDRKASNSLLLRSPEVQYTVEEGRSKLQFTSPRVKDLLLNGTPLFCIPIPSTIVQSDRRAQARIKVPEVWAPIVVLQLPNGRKAEGKLADLSAGGIGVVGLTGNLGVHSGMVIRDCVIELGTRAHVKVDLQVRYMRGTPGPNGLPTYRLGFSLASQPKEFSDLLKAFQVDF